MQWLKKNLKINIYAGQKTNIQIQMEKAVLAKNNKKMLKKQKNKFDSQPESTDIDMLDDDAKKLKIMQEGGGFNNWMID